ncbi:MAG: hypothetical protein ABEJ56_05905 [Candidatus Nanohaloarchaea archaeon]
MPQQDLLNRIVNRVNDFNRRIRDLEEKVRNLTARVNTIDDSLLEKTGDLQDDIKELEDDLEDVRDRIANLEVDIKEINREKKDFITENELEEVENYMDLMNPIKSSFATKKEVKEMIEDGESLGEEEIERMVDRKIKRLEKEEKDNVFE